MAKLVAFYSSVDENYFSGGYRYVTLGNSTSPVGGNFTSKCYFFVNSLENLRKIR